MPFAIGYRLQVNVMHTIMLCVMPGFRQQHDQSASMAVNLTMPEAKGHLPASHAIGSCHIVVHEPRQQT